MSGWGNGPVCDVPKRERRKERIHPLRERGAHQADYGNHGRYLVQGCLLALRATWGGGSGGHHLNFSSLGYCLGNRQTSPFDTTEIFFLAIVRISIEHLGVGGYLKWPGCRCLTMCFMLRASCFVHHWKSLARSRGARVLSQKSLSRLGL